MSELYDEVDGHTNRWEDPVQIAGKAKLDISGQEVLDKVQGIAEYLDGEGLIKTIDSKGDRGGRRIHGVAITHAGVVEVERSRSEPEKPTDHFAPISVVYAETITNSSIQQGSPGATQSLTVINQSGLQELETFLQSLKQSVDQLELDEDQREELEADIQTVEAQIASPKPKQEVMRPGLESIRRILEGSASAAVASPLTATVAAIINNLV